MPQLRPRPLVLGIALAAACLAFGTKLMLIRAYGSDVPYLDEWDAVGRLLLLPRSLGDLHAGNFLEPQNEHRIVLARLLSYSLTVFNGQWDGLLEMTVNAAIHACFCAALLLFARRFLEGVRFAAVALATVSLFVLAFDWENTLQGIQSQFYLLEWGALGMFLLCVPSEPLSPRWWAGWLVGVASLGAMSSGFMAAAAALVLMGVRTRLERRFTGRDAVAGALLAALCLSGLLSIAHVPGHDALRAHSPWEWLAAAAGALSWPEMDWPLAFVVLQLPMAVLILKRLRARRIGRDESVLVALALWAWMQVAAIAFGRANAGMFRSPRYMDLYAVGSFANGLALAILWERGPRARAWGLFAAAWVALFSCGLWARTRQAQRGFLDDYPRFKELERRHVRSFLATGDLARLRSAGPGELPYPRAEPLGRMLAAPGIRALLPMGIRPALPLAPDAGSSGFEISTSSALKPELAARIWMAQKGPARFVSQPLPSGVLPYLHFTVSGSPDLDASVLRLETVDGSESMPPSVLVGERWHSADIAVPGDYAVRVVVEIPQGDHWFAFAEPVELGRGSWLDHWLLRRSGPVAWASGILFGAAWAALLVLDLRKGASRSRTGTPKMVVGPGFEPGKA